MKEESEVLQLAAERGYLLSQGRQARRKRLERAWRMWCWREGQPVVHAWKGYRYCPRVLEGYLEVELSGDWWLSRRLWEAIRDGLPDQDVARFGNRVLIVGLSHRELEQTAAHMLDLLHRNRPGPEEAFDLPPQLARGYARCFWADGMENVMVEDGLYYIREIPNMMGHVVALRDGGLPLVGVHLHRFEMVGE